MVSSNPNWRKRQVLDTEAVDTDPPLPDITLKDSLRSPLSWSERDLDVDHSVDHLTGAPRFMTERSSDDLTTKVRVPSGEEKIPRSHAEELRILRRSILEPPDGTVKGFIKERLLRLEMRNVTTRSNEWRGAPSGDGRTNGDQVLDGVH